MVLPGLPNPPGEPDPSVLFVEDDAVSRRALTMLLEAEGYHTAALASAEEALQRCLDRRCPPVVLIDVDLPGMSGLELAERLSQLDPSVRFIILTAASNDTIQNFCRTHVAVYMRKPLNFDRLLMLLRDAVCSYQGRKLPITSNDAERFSRYHTP